MGPGGIPGIDPLSAEVLGAMRRMMHLNRQFVSRAMTPHGGHPGQQGCLRIIADEEGLSQRDLATKLHLARPTITTMLQRMEADGLVERWTDERDQRLTRIRLTEAGRRVAEETRESFRSYADATLGRLSDDDKRELVRLLGLVGDGITEALGGDPAVPDACVPGPHDEFPHGRRRPNR